MRAGFRRTRLVRFRPCHSTVSTIESDSDVSFRPRTRLSRLEGRPVPQNRCGARRVTDTNGGLASHAVSFPPHQGMAGHPIKSPATTALWGGDSEVNANADVIRAVAAFRTRLTTIPAYLGMALSSLLLTAWLNGRASLPAWLFLDRLLFQ